MAPGFVDTHRHMQGILRNVLPDGLARGLPQHRTADVRVKYTPDDVYAGDLFRRSERSTAA